MKLRKRSPGGGRKKGSGKYGESTTNVRVPISMVKEVQDFALTRGLSIRLYENRVSAGTLTPTDADVVERINLNSLLIRRPEDTFCVRVQGESMIGAGIMSEDLVIVDSKEEPRHGKIVVAAVNGECTVKRLYKAQGRTELRPENSEFDPIPITEEHEVVIWGVVTGVVRQKA